MDTARVERRGAPGWEPKQHDTGRQTRLLPIQHRKIGRGSYTLTLTRGRTRGRVTITLG